MEKAREQEEREGEKARENEKQMCYIHRSARCNICVKRCEINHVLIRLALSPARHMQWPARPPRAMTVPLPEQTHKPSDKHCHQALFIIWLLLSLLLLLLLSYINLSKSTKNSSQFTSFNITFLSFVHNLFSPFIYSKNHLTKIAMTPFLCCLYIFSNSV